MLTKHLPPDHPMYPTVEKQEQLIKTVQANVAQAQSHQQKYYNARRHHVTYSLSQLMWLRAFPQSRAETLHMAKLAPKLKGPVLVVAAMNPVNYQVELLDQPGAFTTHVANRKPFYGSVTTSSEGGSVTGQSQVF